MPQSIQANLIDPRDLLDLLRRHSLPTSLNLALYAEEKGRDGLLGSIHAICRSTTAASPCSRECLPHWEDLISLALLSNQPQTGICPKGLFGFAVPFPASNPPPACLLGAASHDDCRAQPDNDPIPAPFSPLQGRQIAEEIFRLLPRITGQRLHDLSLARLTERLAATREVDRELTRCPSADAAVALASEAMVVLFDLPQVLVILLQNGQKPTIHSCMGVEAGSFEVADDRLQEILEQASGLPVSSSGDELASLLPGIRNHSALVFPLCENDVRIGVLLVLDVDPHPRDQTLIELLVGRLTSRLLHLRQNENLRQDRHIATRMVGMISMLAMANSRESLFNSLLEMSAELTGATNGSLMLFDEESQSLRIATALGMSPPLARTMTMPLGEGIAGRVARNGLPLLVNDIERDSRVGTPNRPRFRTKSFICLPLKDREHLVGVLNLADKCDGSGFTELDLNLVQSFASQAVLLIDRAGTLERASQLERLSVTDPLTGLYNRRFLEERLEEERNRGQREGQPFSLILADLDHFKMYNDICGHLAGDKALRKVAMLMKRSAREMDLVVRFGGEEFCLILPSTSKKESLFVAERLRRAIEADSFPGETNLPLGRLTVSLGIASCPEDAETSHDLIHAADLALYRAKSLGRNRTVRYDPSLANKPTADLLPGEP